jgi:hypothetical protein
VTVFLAPKLSVMTGFKNWYTRGTSIERQGDKKKKLNGFGVLSIFEMARTKKIKFSKCTIIEIV